MTLTADQVSVPVASVREAVTRLEDLAAFLSEGRERDGLRHFNRLYLRVTSLIDLRMGEPDYFRNKPFLETLDVEFANLYLRAVGNELTGGSVSWPWKALFDRRRVRGVARIQFAAAGVNAHITFDLAQALVATWEQRRPSEGDDQRHDYDKVNEIFADLYAPIRNELNDLVAKVDHPRVQKALDDASGLLVTTARREAWDDAEELAELRRSGKGAGRKVFEMSLAAFALNRALLLPVD